MIKKIISGLMALTLAFPLVACGMGEYSKAKEKLETGISSSSTIKDSDNEGETKSKDSSNNSVGLSEDITYTSKNGYSMKIPEGWEGTNSSSSGDIISDELGNNIAFLLTPSNTEFETADESFFRDTYLPGLGGNAKFKSYEEVKIAGHKAHIVRFTNKVLTFEVQQAQAFIDVDGDIFVFTYTDIEGDKPEIFDNAMDSLVIFKK